MEIVIAFEDRCTCDCADKCIIGKIGSQIRCHKTELEELGYKTVRLPKYKKLIFGLYIKIKESWKQ